MGCNIKKFKLQQRGFTLVEILIVVAILALLVAVVVVSVLGFIERGGESGYNEDIHNLKTAVATFVSDKHVYDPANGWNEADSVATPDFKFPTQSGIYPSLHAGDALEIGGQSVYLLVKADDSPAENGDVEEAAIWMGLLVNEPGTGTNPDSKDNSAPLSKEDGLYINEIPKSCSIYNSSQGKGTYTWIIGNAGVVYGVFPDGDSWYIGFSGAYP